MTEAGLVDTTTGRRVDLGFACKVELLQTLERGAADTPLRSRMKIRQTTAKLQDDAIIQNIESLLSHPEGRNFAQALQDSLKESLRETIDKKLDDRQFEYLVKWYMEKLGAQAEIPSKNSSEKPDGADADVIATFDKLNVALYIQVKKHDIGTLSDEEAVDQVLRYTLEIENNDENVTYIPWAITFADDFSEAAKKKAQQAFEGPSHSPAPHLTGGIFANAAGCGHPGHRHIPGVTPPLPRSQKPLLVQKSGVLCPQGERDAASVMLCL